MRFQISKSAPARPLPQFGGTVLGHELAVTNQYLTRDGKPYIYRMGEMHFSRVPEEDWETELQKMKDGGIEIVASYLFWIHHEEEEGVFDFTGNRNLKKFCSVCRKLDMPMFLRMGPWAHGEARNGGFPDWLLEKCGGKDHTRCNEQPYLDYAKRFYAHVYEEVKDCMDVFAGIQIENELHRNPAHMDTLRKYAVELGFRAPIWTATGWGPAGTGAHLPTDEVIPVYGAYPEAPWTQHLDPLDESVGMLFSTNWDQVGDIGGDIFEDVEGSDEKIFKPKEHSYPYLTCELGGGIQISYHRRPVISASDITSLVICRLGSGCNGLGYYMYHGGKNPIGKHTEMMQECRVTGYKNDYPRISYDFQAPLGDSGQIRQSYYDLRSIHRFLEVSGEKLATMPAYLPLDPPEDPFDKSVIRTAVRSNGESGFLFFNNYSRLCEMRALDQTAEIKLASGECIKIPLSVAPGAHGVVPFRFAIGSEIVEWMTALPVEQTEKTLVLEPITGIKPQICLRNGEIIDLAGEIELGGVRVLILPKAVISPTSMQEIEVTPCEKTIPDTVFSHIQNIGWTPIVPIESVDFSLTLPENTNYLRIEALGNVGAIFARGELLSDFYFFGDAWLVDVRHLSAGEELLLKIMPFNEENRSRIYLERSFPLGVHKPRVFGSHILPFAT